MLQFPTKYRPHFYIIIGIIMVVVAARFVERVPYAIRYLFFTGDPILLIATVSFALIAWGIGVTEVYHGIHLWRTR